MGGILNLSTHQLCLNWDKNNEYCIWQCTLFLGTVNNNAMRLPHHWTDYENEKYEATSCYVQNYVHIRYGVLQSSAKICRPASFVFLPSRHKTTFRFYNMNLTGVYNSTCSCLRWSMYQKVKENRVILQDWRNFVTSKFR